MRYLIKQQSKTLPDDCDAAGKITSLPTLIPVVFSFSIKMRSQKKINFYSFSQWSIKHSKTKLMIWLFFCRLEKLDKRIGKDKTPPPKSNTHRKKQQQKKAKHVKVLRNLGPGSCLWSIRLLFFFSRLVLKPIWGFLCTSASVCEDASEVWKGLRNKLFEAVTAELFSVCFGCWSCGRCFPFLAFTPLLYLGCTLEIFQMLWMETSSWPKEKKVSVSHGFPLYWSGDFTYRYTGWDLWCWCWCFHWLL